jgi:membrane-associated phospholipid phosphatase
MRLGLVGGVLFLPLVALGDARLFNRVAAWRTPGLEAAMQVITWLGYGAVDIGILLLMALVGWWHGNGGLRTRGLVGAATVAGAGLLDQLMKNVLCRARPSAPESGAFFANFPCFPAPYAYASFPSGHATTAFAAALLLSLWYPRGTGAFFGLAVLVGLSRVVLGSHFPSDVLAGALLGCGVALFVHEHLPAARRIGTGPQMNGE